jgi:hypothetical protein
MSKEAEIKSVIEEYLNLEESLKYNYQEKAQSQQRYNKLVRESRPEENAGRENT